MISSLTAVLAACGDDTGDAPAGASSSENSSANEKEGTSAGATSAGNPDPYAQFPLHGLVTGLQLQVRRRPHHDSDVIGWLRLGNRVRTRRMAQRTANCGSGWHPIYPRGFACAGQGLEIDESPPDSELAAPPPNRNAALPYSYWYVKDGMTPEYHRAPSRSEQRRADQFAAHYMELLEQDPTRAAKYLAGELDEEPQKPAVVHRYLDRGFFVAGVGHKIRSQRRFVRTVRSRFVAQSRVIERTGSTFRGIVLDDATTLPIAWATREAHYRIRRDRDDGTRFVKDMELEPIARHTHVTNWQRRINADGTTMHALETEAGERYVRAWFLSVAEKRSRPRRIAEDEPWVHINLDQQTLVMYEGDRPVFATLISSGQEGFNTPTGLFVVQKKYVADTMANIGDGNDERYSIEDVPWAQYFDRSVALHGAFWHTRFGLQRSHGCVNLSPADAQFVFSFLWPHVPDGWLGVQPGNDRKARTSHVWVTAD